MPNSITSACEATGKPILSLQVRKALGEYPDRRKEVGKPLALIFVQDLQNAIGNTAIARTPNRPLLVE